MKQGLNAEQAQALDVLEGPVLILAGAGSGKTKTLTHRIAELIANHGVWPDEILAVTFTNKAAKEMRTRLWQLLGSGHIINATEGLASPKNSQGPPRSFMSWMGTFHGICVKLLRQDGGVIGVERNFIIYDDDDRLRLIKQAMKELSISDKQFKPRMAVSIISKAKNDLQSPEDYANSSRLPRSRDIAKIYARYEELRSEARALDFDDILLEAVRMLRTSPEIRTRWRHHFRHILVDEYQDTNAAQYALIHLLVNESHNICVVGDDWQSIYSWRGADYTNILNFERDFPGATVIKLEQNYRSTQAILDTAHAVISKNIDRTEKKLWTKQGRGEPIEVHRFYDEAEEAYAVAQLIASQVAIGARDYDDFAVLYRINAQSSNLERALLQQHIPYQIVGGVRFYDRREVKDIVAYLRLIYQPRDTVSFSRIVNLPPRGVGAKSLENFLTWQAQTPFDIITALANVDQTDRLQTRAKRALSQLGETLRHLQAATEQGIAPHELIERVLDQTGYGDYLRDGRPEADDREENIGALVSDAHNFASLGDFLQEVSLMSSTDVASTSGRVTLMTLHAAKGLEFPVVWMVGLEEGIFPHSRVFKSGPAELEEERRLCYVGITRAREMLHLSYASSRLQFGQRTYGQPSRFLSDIGYEAVDYSGSMGFIGTQKDELVFDDTQPFDIGDRVKSLQFGEGEVIDIDGMAASVRFDNGQTKKLNIEYARLAKLS